ncbi:MAG: outer membrane protein assembly factor BamB [Gammaproteobacteria bacterium]|nr:outer membrane protein assembly factor BamB [Gammaproteobacteria bacterium]
MRALLLLLLGVLFLTGCTQFSAVKELATSVEGLISGTDNAEPPKELEPLEPTVAMNILWKTSVGKGYDGRVVNLVPAVTSSAVYVADRRGLLEAHARQDGERLWSHETALEISAGPVVAGDKLLMGTSNAEIIAVSIVDGALLWKATLTSEMLALPRVAHNVVVVRTSDGRLVGLDLQHGGLKWSHERSIPPLSVRSQGSPTIVGDLVLDGFGGGKLIALSLQDGRLVWETTAATGRGRSEVERLVELDADPLVEDETVYITGFQAGITAVNIPDGEILWHQNGAYSSHGMAPGRHAFFISDTNSDVARFDSANGVEKWKQTALHQRRLTVPATVRNYVVVGDFEGYLHALSADDGRLVGRLEMDNEPILAPPVFHEETLFVYSSSGVLAAIGIN